MSDHESTPNVNDVSAPLSSLKHVWTVYDHTKCDSGTYEQSTRKVCDIDSVIKFWQVFNNYPPPSKLFMNGKHKHVMNTVDGNKEISSISVFKNGILPKWEDPMNMYGGELSKRKFNRRDPLSEIDTNWLDMLMACVGADVDDCITGIRVVDSSCIKRGESGENEFKALYRIEVWFDKVANKSTVEKIITRVMPGDDFLHYKEHKIK